ncbi:FAD-binding protein [Sphingobium phenoxybenzoativorans]|uniref:FAD-binding protein n=1 Tax=Sphingobium phenoxybenzoativorans TaxID=1592790 RepID=A0A975K3C9_9SPHN|nr:FAD-dependent oxidoreductase [Sphingobium phenoxybenzoativorans]QUT04139.1 FAD-binding protein [Sphingobium phenoxybenzoativorans]
MNDYDVIVLGTGAAGLTAAITAHEGGARVGVFEKAETVGGTSAWSGGQIWIPNNPHELAEGKEDSREKALTYLMSLSHGMIDPAMAEAYIDTGPEMIHFLEARTPVEFYAIPDFPDYHPEFPGGMPEGGRTLECPTYPYGELGAWKDRVGTSPYYPDFTFTIGETTLGKPVPTPAPPEVKEQRRRNDERGMGLALIGRLLKGCLDRGIEPHTESRALELVIEDGAVAGVRFEGPDGPFTVRAGQVILATGGFEWNKDMIRAFTRGPLTHPVSIKTNTGDGLKMAMRAGAMLGNMREAWWMPVIEVPTEINPMGRQLLTYERTMPGTLMVNRHGKRFTNEASNYNAFGAAFHEQDVSRFEYGNLPCWLIFNQDFYAKWPFVGGLPDSFGGDARPPQWIPSADTLEGLAERVGIDPAQLGKTVKTFNAYAEAGEDPDFRRGESANDLWWGDPAHRGSKRATLGPLGDGPYYAVEVKSGCLGTKGGPQTDTRARVLDVDGAAIPGLFAAGNVMASPMGMTYGGAGGTLGPGMVFGYLAGKTAGENVAAVGKATESV